MSTDDVYIFEIAPEDFDAGLLPESARQPGSPEFKDQVRRFFERNLEAFAGWHDISIEDDKIRVSWKASADKADALSEIIKKLRDGEYQEGIQLLRFLLPSREKDSAVPYNLGMALSDTGDLDEAEKHLRKAIEIDPTFTNAKVALGVTLSRKRQWEQAASVLEEAVKEEPAESLRPSQSGCVPPGIGQESSREDALPSQGDSTPAGRPAVLDEPWPSLGFAKRGR